MTLRDDGGRLVVLEGPDGVGKTTLAQSLADDLGSRGRTALVLSFPGRTTGTLGELVYRLHHEPDALGVTQPVDAASLQLLHIAAHVDAIESTIRPAIQEGQWVILDRYWWSTRVYGVAANVDSESLDRMISVELSHWRDLQPDPVFLVQRHTGDPVLAGLYDRLADQEKHRTKIVSIDNNGTPERSVSQMLEELLEAEEKKWT